LKKERFKRYILTAIKSFYKSVNFWGLLWLIHGSILLGNCKDKALKATRKKIILRILAKPSNISPFKRYIVNPFL
jgi:hypothetical protein